MIIIACFLFYLSNAEAFHKAEERFIGLSIPNIDEVKTLIDERILNSAMASQVLGFTTGKMKLNLKDVPSLLDADINNFHLLTSGQEGKGILYTKNINNRKTLVIAFRGTSTKREILTDLNFFSSNITIRGYKIGIHTGFFNTFKSMKEQILKTAQNIAKQEQIEEILITGHSLGGAVANIASLFIKDALDIPISLITFEAPKPFNRQGADLVEEMIGTENIHRYVDSMDRVPKLGYNGTFGSHAGKEVDSTWNILQPTSMIDAHKMGRIATNIALYARITIERYIKEQKLLINNDIALRIERLNKEYENVDKELVSLRIKKYLLKEIKLEKDDIRLISLVRIKKYNLKVRHKELCRDKEKEISGRAHRLSLIDEAYKNVNNSDELFISRTEPKKGVSTLNEFFKTLFSLSSDDVEKTLREYCRSTGRKYKL
jgi:hypothetical protein